MRELHPRARRLARLGAPAAATNRRAELDQRPRVLELGAGAFVDLGALPEQLNLPIVRGTEA